MIFKEKKFNHFVETNKKAIYNRLKYEFEEKKNFVLSISDINTVMEAKEERKGEEKKPLYPRLKSSFKLSTDDFEDIFQESVIALYNNIGTPITCTLSSYFFFICRNQALKHIRREGRMEHYNDEKNISGYSPQELNTILGTIPTERIHPQIADTPDIVFELSSMKEQVYKALDEMATKCKQLLTKFYIEGYSWTELALQFDLNSADTAKVTAKRCRNRFKEKYKELEVYVKEK